MYLSDRMRYAEHQKGRRCMILKVRDGCLSVPAQMVTLGHLLCARCGKLITFNDPFWCEIT